MSELNFDGSMQDLTKIKRQQEIGVILDEVLMDHFKYMNLRNSTEFMSKNKVICCEWDLMNIEHSIRSKVNLYPEILKKSSILAKYWG